MTASMLHALLGGALIGAAAGLLLLVNGRIAGISGILGRVTSADLGDQGWRIAFLAGLLAPALVFGTGTAQLHPGWTWAVVSGLLVGFGTRLGRGCTSGHGVCGLANLSGRSLLATLVFMATALVTVWVVRHGGLA
ncbi:MAG TPA: YeeE/YedE family protein [Gammaproteobacteria bacterium]|jgi:uncharacterized membrane protein YedE/YeeE|nr:YeeE/YedE family protein [Gammaproteobacteria bacterium]